MKKRINKYLGVTFLTASSLCVVAGTQHTQENLINKKVYLNKDIVHLANKYQEPKVGNETNLSFDKFKQALKKETNILQVINDNDNFYLIAENTLKYFDAEKGQFIKLTNDNEEVKKVWKLGKNYYTKVYSKNNEEIWEFKKLNLKNLIPIKGWNNTGALKDVPIILDGETVATQKFSPSDSTVYYEKENLLYLNIPGNKGFCQLINDELVVKSNEKGVSITNVKEFTSNGIHKVLAFGSSVELTSVGDLTANPTKTFFYELDNNKEFKKVIVKGQSRINIGNIIQVKDKVFIFDDKGIIEVVFSEKGITTKEVKSEFENKNLYSNFYNRKVLSNIYENKKGFFFTDTGNNLYCLSSKHDESKVIKISDKVKQFIEYKGSVYIVRSINSYSPPRTSLLILKNDSWELKPLIWKNTEKRNISMPSTNDQGNKTIFKTKIDNKEVLYFVANDNNVYKLNDDGTKALLVSGIKIPFYSEANQFFKVGNKIYYSAIFGSSDENPKEENTWRVYEINNNKLSAKETLRSKKQNEDDYEINNVVVGNKLYVILKKQIFIVGNKIEHYEFKNGEMGDKYRGSIKSFLYNGKEIRYISPYFENDGPLANLSMNVNFFEKSQSFSKETEQSFKLKAKFIKNELVLPSVMDGFVYEYKIKEGSWTKTIPNNLKDVKEIAIRLVPDKNTFLSKKYNPAENKGILLTLDKLKPKSKEKKLEFKNKKVEFKFGFISEEEKQELITLKMEITKENGFTNKYGFELFEKQYNKLLEKDQKEQKTYLKNIKDNFQYNDLGFPGVPKKVKIDANANKITIDKYKESVLSFNNISQKKLEEAKKEIKNIKVEFKFGFISKEEKNGLLNLKNKIINNQSYESFKNNHKKLLNKDQTKQKQYFKDAISLYKYNDLGFPGVPKKVKLAIDANKAKIDEYKEKVHSFNELSQTKLKEAKELLGQILKKRKNNFSAKKIASFEKQIKNDVKDFKTYKLVLNNLKKTMTINNQNKKSTNWLLVGIGAAVGLPIIGLLILLTLKMYRKSKM